MFLSISLKINDNKYYTQAFLDKCLSQLKMLYYDWIDVSEVIYVNKTSVSKVWYLPLLVFFRV